MQRVEKAEIRRETADFPTFMLDAALGMQYARDTVGRCRGGIFRRSGVSLSRGCVLLCFDFCVGRGTLSRGVLTHHRACRLWHTAISGPRAEELTQTRFAFR